MKKTLLSWLVLSAVLSLGSLSFAEDERGSEERPPMKKGMKGKGMMGGPMMMDMMSKKTVVATSDGGVVILTGNHIAKYDKDLNLVNETDLKVDMEAMKKDMAAMMKACMPPPPAGAKETEGEPEETPDSPAEGAKADSSEDHSSHH